MAIAINHAFTNPKADGADTTIVRPSDWNAALVWSGLGTNQLLYSSDATTLAQSANLGYSEASGPQFTVGAGNTTNAGVTLAYGGVSGYSVICHSNRTPALNTSALTMDNTETFLNSPGTTWVSAAQVNKIQIQSTAGWGAAITAGTATTDVQALSATQTWNASGVAFTAIKATVTNTASAAGSKIIDLIVGSSSQFAVSPAGLITTGGTDGVATFGPAAVASITVKNGIITAIS